MSKMKTKGWPIRMWAVCYRDLDRTPGWTPYSEEVFHNRGDAEKACSQNARVMAVYVWPTHYIRRADSAGDVSARSE